MLINVTKYIAHSGLCSRRDAKELVTSGKVQVNGSVVYSSTTKISFDDEVLVNNKSIKILDEPRLWIFHKPTGVITTNKDPQNRKTIFDILPKSLPRLVSVGRLDINSEGLILLTNNGSLARYFELPENNISRTYSVRIFGKIDGAVIAKLSHGTSIDGVRYKGILIRVIKESASNSWIEMTLTEGKNREIRKILGSMNIKISRLKREKYGNYSLDGLAKGQIKEVKINERDYENYIRKTQGA